MSLHPRYLHKYVLHELVGQGGLAKVWKAYDPQLQRYVAIKQLRPEISSDPDFLARFIREAQLVATLHHPNIVQVYDFQITTAGETREPIAYMVMEYIEGQTLADYIRRASCQGRYPTHPTDKDLLQLFSAIGQAVDYAHAQGMIHRDIKPANILLNRRNLSHLPDGEPILSDFGIARLVESSEKTHTHGWIGTPLYISPEQAQGQTGSQASDIYSLGIILYEICTGVQPFRGANIPAIMLQHVNFPPPSPCQINPAISPVLASVIMRCLAKDPTQRFSRASDLTAALAGALKLSAPADPADFEAPTILSRRRPVNPPAPTNGKLSQPASKNSLAQSLPLANENPRVPPLPNKKRRGLFAILLAAMLIPSLVVGRFYWPARSQTSNNNQVIGRFSFDSSDIAAEGSDNGENDRVIVDVRNLSSLANNHVYYAWLLGDDDPDKDSMSILSLGSLSANQGNAHLVYNDPNHANLLDNYSRLLITEEVKSTTAPVAPAQAPNDRRYKAEIAQDNCDHRPHCQLENLRRLLATNPALVSPRMQTKVFGGLNVLLFRNTEKVLIASNNAYDYWYQKSSDNFRNQLIQILDYLDGDQYVSHDLQGMPPGNLNTSPNSAPVGLTVDDPGIMAPYLLRVRRHVNNLLKNAGVTPAQRQQAMQIYFDLGNALNWLQRAHNDAEQLLKLPSGNIFLPASQRVLNDMLNSVRYAYEGRFDSNGNQFLGGIVQSYYGIQELASFDITPA